MNKRSGIYLVQPQQSELKIIYNQNDANKVGNYETILKVNKNNLKFGQSKNFHKRFEEFIDIFGSNVKFVEVVEIDNYAKLSEFKKHIKEIFRSYCLKSLKNERIMDWMKDISLEKAQKTILDEYKKFD